MADTQWLSFGGFVFQMMCGADDNGCGLEGVDADEEIGLQGALVWVGLRSGR